MVNVYGKLLDLMGHFLKTSLRSQLMLIAAILATGFVLYALKL